MMSTDLVKKSPRDTSAGITRDGHFIFVSPVKPGPVFPIANEELEARDRRLIGMGGRAISHSGDCKFENIKKRLEFHDKNIYPSEGLYIWIICNSVSVRCVICWRRGCLPCRPSTRTGGPDWPKSRSGHRWRPCSGEQ